VVLSTVVLSTVVLSTVVLRRGGVRRILQAERRSRHRLILIDAAGVVRVRRDGGGPLARLLDGVWLAPGYDFSERVVGTTAASVAWHERTGIAIGGPEHYHSRLLFLGGAASTG
jgi:transcriptional regulator of acetoin/glycerol metabolism